MRLGVICTFFCVLSGAVCVGWLALGRSSSGKTQWSELERDALRRKAAEAYSREYGWDGPAKYRRGNDVPAGIADGIETAEAALLARLRRELGADVGHAAGLVRRLSERAIYERLMFDPSDAGSLAVLNEIEDGARSASKRLGEIHAGLRRYAKSSTGELAAEYSATLALYERAIGLYGRILSHIEKARGNTAEISYETALSAGYSAMASELRRMETEYEKACK